MVAFLFFLSACAVGVLAAHRLVADVGERYRTPAMGGTVLAFLTLAPRGLLDGSAAATAVAGYGLMAAFAIALLAGTKGHPAEFVHPSVREKVFGATLPDADEARRRHERHQRHVVAWFTALAVAPTIAAVIWT